MGRAHPPAEDRAGGPADLSQSSLSQPKALIPCAWQPIETAPDSCVSRLLYEPSDGDRIFDPAIYIGNYGVDCEWRDDEGHIVTPTHWMPLPEPPEA